MLLSTRCILLRGRGEGDLDWAPLKHHGLFIAGGRSLPSPRGPSPCPSSPHSASNKGSPCLLGKESLVLLSVIVANVPKIDFFDVWLTAFSLEDIFLIEKKGSKEQRAFFLAGALTAFGSHWDLPSFLALYFHPLLRHAFGKESAVIEWSPGLVERWGGWESLSVSYDQTLASRLCSGDLELPGPGEMAPPKVTDRGNCSGSSRWQLLRVTGSCDNTIGPLSETDHGESVYTRERGRRCKSERQHATT